MTAMKPFLIFISIVLIANLTSVKASYHNNHPQSKIETANDSLRILELNDFWNELSRTVKEGDFEGYKATYHEDAVVIFATGENKVSIPISKALANWKQGFNDTKAGKTQGSVEFRFSQRIGDSTTAHETGIFLYQSYDGNGKNISNSFVHFEMLFVKQKGVWLGLMEYQKSKATQEEWELLE